MYDRRIQWIYNLLDTVFSIFRVLSHTKFKPIKRIERKHEKCIIMGTGPSLIDSLEENEKDLNKVDLIAVNFMGFFSEYVKYKPNTYVLCDSGFWFEGILEEVGEKVEAFYWALVEKTDWLLQLYIPNQAQKEKKIRDILSQNANIRLNYYNKTKFEGYKSIKYWIYRKQWGMPRAQNVLIAALMLSIYSNYKEIYLAGVDSDNMKNIWVDEKNQVRLTDIHYYKEEQQHIECVLPIKLHEQCAAFYFMFKSYMDIASYAVSRKVKIYNMNPLSFIDAFEKIKIKN